MSNAVPDGWRLQTIGELVKLQYGKSPKEVMSEGGQYPVIGTGGVTGFASSYLFDGSTTVIGRKGTINKPSYVEGKFWAIDTTYFGVDYKGAEPKWFYYSLNSFDLTKYNEASGVPSLGRDTLNAIPLSVPPLHEQQKIAAILSSVDDVIEKTRAQIDKLKDLKTGMMQELLTKGIGHTAFKDSPVGRIPEGWEVTTLGEIFPKIVVGYVGNVNDHYCGKEEGIPFYRTLNIRDGFIRHAPIKYVTREFNEKTKKSQIFNEDILIARVGANLGMTCKVTGLSGPANIANAIIIKSAVGASSDFYMEYIRSPYGQSQIQSEAAGGAQGVFNTKLAQELVVPVPSLGEQISIAQKLLSLDNLIHAKESALEREHSIKKALMQDLLTGKVRVNVDNKENAVA